MTANGISFGPDLLPKCQTFSQAAAQYWHGLTPMAIQEPASHLNFNLSDPYGGYSMVWSQLIWFHDRKWDQLSVLVLICFQSAKLSDQQQL
jgi:hypothetical protein